MRTSSFILLIIFAVLGTKAKDLTLKLLPFNLPPTFYENLEPAKQIKLLERNATLFEDLFWVGINTTLYSNSEKKATFNGWAKSYYGSKLNTKLRKLCYYSAGRPIETITIKPNGERCIETTLRNGNGREVHWHPNGVRREISNCKNGLANGEFKMWYSNGNLECEGTYLNGFLHGIVINYQKDGSALSEAQYEKGKFLFIKPPWSSFNFRSSEEEAFWNKLDEWEINDETKRINTRGEKIDINASDAFTGYVKERTFSKEVSKKSSLRILNHYKDGFLQRCKSWHQSGKVNYDFKYKSGQREGLSVAWHGNGQKKTEQNFKDDKLDGVMFEWHENGQKKLEMNFKRGKKHGPFKIWDKYGENKLEGKFKEDEKEKL
ncbi:hypothetical protein N8133_01275 [bacterium]|nr:hypothetical protein [bacterium]